jgi:hypothetical protein
MCKSIAAIAGLTAILSLGSLISAYAGGASSAPSKYDNASQNQWRTQATSYTITRILFVFGESVEEAEALSLKSMTLPRRSGIDHE